MPHTNSPPVPRHPHVHDSHHMFFFSFSRTSRTGIHIKSHSTPYNATTTTSHRHTWMTVYLSVSLYIYPSLYIYLSLYITLHLSLYWHAKPFKFPISLCLFSPFLFSHDYSSTTIHKPCLPLLLSSCCYAVSESGEEYGGFAPSRGYASGGPTAAAFITPSPIVVVSPSSSSSSFFSYSSLTILASSI